MRKAVIAGLATLTVATAIGWIYSYGGFRGSFFASQSLADDGGFILVWTVGYGRLAAECKYKLKTTPASRTQLRRSFLRFALEDEVTTLPRIKGPGRSSRKLYYPYGVVPYTPPAPPVWIRRVWVQFPLWFPTIIFAAYPTLVLIRGPLARYRRRKRGLCARCGYNMTGNVSGRCPECGEAT